MIEIYNENCLDTMRKMEAGQVDIVLTSPFYNTNEKAGKTRTTNNVKVKAGQYTYVRYDAFVDVMSDDEYENFTIQCFKNFENIVSTNGVVLWQISYGSKGAQRLIDLMSSISKNTDWTCADIIVWKKKSCIPNSCSPNKLTRITEYVFVFCRKDEFYSFLTNKQITSKRNTGQNAYENIYNFIEAKNNDGACDLNKATYSTELCIKLLNIYARKGDVVYDPFMGTGTTAVACKELGLNCYGSELSAAQCQYAKKRLSDAIEALF